MPPRHVGVVPHATCFGGGFDDRRALFHILCLCVGECDDLGFEQIVCLNDKLQKRVLWYSFVSGDAIPSHDNGPRFIDMSNGETGLLAPPHVRSDIDAERGVRLGRWLGC